MRAQRYHVIFSRTASKEVGVVIWNWFYLKSRFRCGFLRAHFVEAYRKRSGSIRRTQEKVTGRILPSSGKSGILGFGPSVIKFYLNELPGSLFSICQIKAQELSSSQNLIETDGQSSCVQEAKLRNWIQCRAELTCLLLRALWEMDKTQKAIFSCPATVGRPQTRAPKVSCCLEWNLPATGSFRGPSSDVNTSLRRDCIPAFKEGNLNL